MKFTKSNNLTLNADIALACKKVDINTDVDHLKPHVPYHRKLRDQLTGEDVAGMKSETQARIFNKIIDYMADILINQHDWERADVAQAEFADLYNHFRDVELKKYNGKSSHKSEFWGLAWGIYSDYIVSAAKKKLCTIGHKNAPTGTKPIHKENSMKQTKIDYDHFRWYQKLMRDVESIKAQNLSKSDMILYIALLRMPDIDTYGYREAMSEAIRKPLTQEEKDEIVGSYNNGKWWSDHPGLDDL